MAAYVVRYENTSDLVNPKKKEREQADEIIEKDAPTFIDGNKKPGTLEKNELVRLDLQGQFNRDNIRYANLQMQLNKPRFGLTEETGNDDIEADKMAADETEAAVKTRNDETEAAKEAGDDGMETAKEGATGITSDDTNLVGKPKSTTIAIVLMPSGKNIPENISKAAFNGSLDRQMKAIIEQA